MPLTPEQQANLDQLRAFLGLLSKLCPRILRLQEVVARWDANIAEERIHFDSKKVTDSVGDQAAPAFTDGDNHIFVIEDYSPQRFDMSKPSGLELFSTLFSTLIHEMFHQLGSNHPITYDETARFLGAVRSCVKRHRIAVIEHFGWTTERMFEDFDGQLAIQRQAEQEQSGGGRLLGLVAIDEKQTIHNCHEYLIIELHDGERLRLEVTENDADGAATLDIARDGSVIGGIAGDGTAYVDGPGRIKVHLRGAENYCILRYTIVEPQ